MIPSLDLTGGAGGAAGPATSGQNAAQTAAAGSGTSGNRGFQNNFAAAGANLKADAGINGPAGSGFPWMWAALAAVAIALWWVLRKH